jgi:hypothetical protein
MDSIEIVGLLLNVEGSFDFDASNFDLSDFTESITSTAGRYKGIECWRK